MFVKHEKEGEFIKGLIVQNVLFLVLYDTQSISFSFFFLNYLEIFCLTT